MSALAATLLYMSVSLLSLGVQSTALLRILIVRHSAALVRQGLVRTASCRVAASVTYVGLGVAALVKAPATSMAALVVLLLVQIMWQINGVLDSQLSRRLAAKPTKHRRHR